MVEVRVSLGMVHAVVVMIVMMMRCLAPLVAMYPGLEQNSVVIV